eukprot:SAG22_NODE_1039_length_5888_cov_4.141302_1_plen_224_part_10
MLPLCDQIFANALESIAQGFEKHGVHLDVYNLQSKLQFPDADANGLLSNTDLERCCARLARDLVSVYLTMVLTLTAEELAELNIVGRSARDVHHGRDILVKDLLVQDMIALKNILGCFCPEELHLRRIQTVNAVRELLSCSRDDFKLFVQTAAMNNPDIFAGSFLRLVVDIRSDWTNEEGNQVLIECSNWMNSMSFERMVRRENETTGSTQVPTLNGHAFKPLH